MGRKQLDKIHRSKQWKDSDESGNEEHRVVDASVAALGQKIKRVYVFHQKKYYNNKKVPMLIRCGAIIAIAKHLSAQNPDICDDCLMWWA